jgi:hypothetical protein
MSKISYIIRETPSWKAWHMQASNQVGSSDFYTNCMKYFEALRKQGKQDFAFEDEFFYTMPAISEKIITEQ